jgi:hypothetical protein
MWMKIALVFGSASGKFYFAAQKLEDGGGEALFNL